MSQFSSEDDVAPWLRSALTRQLGPVAAPVSLWHQIQAVKPRRGFSLHLPVLVMAGMAVLVTVSVLVAGWRVGAGRSQANDLETLALTNSRTALDFMSDNPAEVRRWVKVKTDIDIELAERTAPVTLLGARVIRVRGASVAAIAYRTDDNDSGTLFVSKNCDALQRKPEQAHAMIQAGAHGTKVYSWNARNQSYAMAFANPKNPQADCVLCHANARGI